MIFIYQKIIEMQKTMPFFSGLADCKEVQERLLKSIIRKNERTLFGMEYHFESISRTYGYRLLVPLQDYSSISKYVEKEKNGEKNTLVSEQIIYYAITSGTTDCPKYILQTESYIKKLRRSWKIWDNLLYKNAPETLSNDGSVLALTSKPFDGKTPQGIEYGSISGFLYNLQPSFIKKIYAIPQEIFLIENYQLRYYLIVIFSVKKNLTLIVTPNPSTMIVFAKKMDEHAKEMIDDLENNQIKRLNDEPIDEGLKKVLQKKFMSKNNKDISKKLASIKSANARLVPKDAFKNLNTLACWKGGSVGIYIKKLSQYYGHTKIMDLGYIASEGRFTIPTNHESDGDGVLDIYSNFYEFIEVKDYDSNKRKTLLAHEVVPGKKYYIIITNENGLYRYFMDDIIEVVAFYKNTRTPIIRFLQKGKYVSSITGEKITEWEVVAAMHELTDMHTLDYRTFFAKPNTNSDMPYYEFFIEFRNQPDIKKLEISLDLILKKLNIEYDQKRKSLRLGKAQIIHLPKGGFEKLKHAFTKTSDTQVKVPKLFVLKKDLEILKHILR